MKQVYDKRTIELVSEVQSAIDNGEISTSNPEKMTALVMALFEGFSFMANLRAEDSYFEEFGEYFYQKAWSMLSTGDTTISSGN